jgi:hypothetical protein
MTALQPPVDTLQRLHYKTAMRCLIYRKWSANTQSAARHIKHIVVFSLVGFLFGCAPYVETVQYTKYSNRYKDNLWMSVNTRRGLFQGRESFFNFKRDEYFFSFRTHGDALTQDDIDIAVYAGTQARFSPKTASVNITNKDTRTAMIVVHVDDDRIPKTLNGTYELKVSEVTADQVWYTTK